MRKIDYAIVIGIVLLALATPFTWYNSIFPINELENYPIYKGYEILMENISIVLLYVICIIVQLLTVKKNKYFMISVLCYFVLGIFLFLLPVISIYDLPINMLFTIDWSLYSIMTKLCIPSFEIGIYIVFVILIYLMICNIMRCFIFRK